jgi:hypothetical protein
VVGREGNKESQQAISVKRGGVQSFPGMDDVMINSVCARRARVFASDKSLYSAYFGIFRGCFCKGNSCLV